MRNPLELLKELVGTIPAKDVELVFQTDKGDIISLEDSVNITGGKVIQRSAIDAENNVLVELFGDNNITSSMYVEYLNVMTSINDVVVKSLSTGAKNYLKKTNKAHRLELIDFPNRNSLKAIPQTSENKPNLKWNKKAVKELAIGCKGRTELKDKSPSAYKAALRYGWLDELFA